MYLIKKKHIIVEPVTFTLSIILSTIFVLGPIALGYALVQIEQLVITREDIKYVVFFAFLYLIDLIVVCLIVLPRGCPSIVLYEDYLIRRAPFKKTSLIKYTDINYAGIYVLFPIEQIKNSDTSIAEIYLCSYIYVSKTYCKFRCKDDLNKAYNMNGIIIFKYTEKLYHALVNRLPNSIQSTLDYQYNSIKRLSNKNYK